MNKRKFAKLKKKRWRRKNDKDYRKKVILTIKYGRNRGNRQGLQMIKETTIKMIGKSGLCAVLIQIQQMNLILQLLYLNILKINKFKTKMTQKH